MVEMLKYLGSVIGALLLFAGVAVIAASNQTGDYSKAVYMVRTETGHGTGFYIGGNRIITAAHVASIAGGVGKEMTVTRDDIKFQAVVLWMDDTRDVAMLKITDPHAFEKAPKAKLSCERPDAAIGTPVHSIGYPLDLGLTYTWGHVAGRPFRNAVKSDEGDVSLRETYQALDLAIAPGNSGGPVFDDMGEVIGLSDAVPVVPMDVTGPTGPLPMLSSASLAPFALVIPRTSICNSIFEHLKQEQASN